MMTRLGAETLSPASAGLERGPEIPDKESSFLQLA